MYTRDEYCVGVKKLIIFLINSKRVYETYCNYHNDNINI